MNAAQAAYAARQAKARQLVERLSQALDRHAEAASAQPRVWGFAGDLGTVCANLIEGLGMLGALTDEERALHEV